MGKYIRVAAFALLFAFAVFLLISATGSAAGAEREGALDAARNAVMRSAVTCYALEGQYPEDLEYLEENYGLVLNREKYVYHYIPQGSNLTPEIAVFAK